MVYNHMLEFKNRTAENNNELKKERKDAGDNMERLNLAYCNDCEDLVEFDVHEETVTELYKGENVQFKFRVGRCKYCGEEVATDIDYNARKSEAKINAYKKIKGLITLEEITEILEKYDVGKEALADIEGFGKATVKRYYEGFIPAKSYSDLLIKSLNDETFFIEAVKKNRHKLKEVTYNKIIARYNRLLEIKNSKIDQIANYIIIHLGEVTPLALEKLLAFSNGVNYAVNGKQLIFEESQAWQHGPVYPQIYSRYKKYGYKPIDNGIQSTHGCMLSLLSEDEIKAIDMVIHTFGLYSPKTLEMISHSQLPWQEKRIGYGEDEAGREVINEDSIRDFYVNNDLSSEEKILKYIMETVLFDKLIISQSVTLL